ncbi:hypothetical protein OGATHE_000255 [Ogataea polymorpha]|uniref:Uncharacterized protein n=1 Tax=Ogataea polymorpha TaxID=460523 RepID=A0A9P8PW77_9ASCO|nr:hypothetical protein OGATHE_000255 [Ogataea polymorpha]
MVAVTDRVKVDVKYTVLVRVESEETLGDAPQPVVTVSVTVTVVGVTVAAGAAGAEVFDVEADELLEAVSTTVVAWAATDEGEASGLEVDEPLSVTVTKTVEVLVEVVVISLPLDS